MRSTNHRTPGQPPRQCRERACLRGADSSQRSLGPRRRNSQRRQQGRTNIAVLNTAHREHHVADTLLVKSRNERQDVRPRQQLTYDREQVLVGKCAGVKRFERGVVAVSGEPIFQKTNGKTFLRAIGGSFPTSDVRRRSRLLYSFCVSFEIIAGATNHP